MKKYLATGMAVMLLFPAVTFAQAPTMSAQTRQSLEDQLQRLELELAAVLSSQNSCPSGKEPDTSGTCQWTASSTAIIAANAAYQTSQQDIAAANAKAQTQQEISQDKQDYQQYVTDVQALQAKIQQACTLTTLKSANSYGGTTVVSEGNAAIAAQLNATDCNSVTVEADAEILADQEQEASIQNQISVAQASIGN